MECDDGFDDMDHVINEEDCEAAALLSELSSVMIVKQQGDDETNYLRDALARGASLHDLLKKKRKTPQKWEVDEEARFVESLERFGRDWKKCSEFIGTRDADAVRSHAQKYFIKLWDENLQLPVKVMETGTGYTLSGKPLDAESASVKKYLVSKMKKAKRAQTAILRQMEGSATKKMKIAESGISTVIPFEYTDEGSPSRSFHPGQNEIEIAQPQNLQEIEGVPNDSVETEGVRRYSIESTHLNDDMDANDELLQTESKHSSNSIRIPKELDHEIVWIDDKSGLPCFNNDENQIFIDFASNPSPFKVTMCDVPFFLAEMHSHIIGANACGLFAGYWNPIMQEVIVTDCIPLPPTAFEFAENIQILVEETTSRNLYILGYYTSRNTEHTLPSLADSKLFEMIKENLGYDDSIPLFQIIQGPFVSEDRYSTTVYSKNSMNSPEAVLVLDFEITSTPDNYTDLSYLLPELSKLTGPIPETNLFKLLKSPSSHLSEKSKHLIETFLVKNKKPCLVYAVAKLYGKVLILAIGIAKVALNVFCVALQRS